MNSFYYDGKLVWYFADKLNADGNYNSFTRANGAVDSKAVRNANYELTEITTVSQEEYDIRTESIKKVQAANTQYLDGAATHFNKSMLRANLPKGKDAKQ
jgi:hypothetical protein